MTQIVKSFLCSQGSCAVASDLVSSPQETPTVSNSCSPCRACAVGSSGERALAALSKDLRQRFLCNLENPGSKAVLLQHISVLDVLDSSCCSGRDLINVCYTASSWHLFLEGDLLAVHMEQKMKAGTLQSHGSHFWSLNLESGLQYWTNPEGRLQRIKGHCAKGSFHAILLL